MEEDKITKLAQTLFSKGIAASMWDAKKKAIDIMGITDQKIKQMDNAEVPGTSTESITENQAMDISPAEPVDLPEEVLTSQPSEESQEPEKNSISQIIENDNVLTPEMSVTSATMEEPSSVLPQEETEEPQSAEVEPEKGDFSTDPTDDIVPPEDKDEESEEVKQFEGEGQESEKPDFIEEKRDETTDSDVVKESEHVKQEEYQEQESGAIYSDSEENDDDDEKEEEKDTAGNNPEDYIYVDDEPKSENQTDEKNVFSEVDSDNLEEDNSDENKEDM